MVAWVVELVLDSTPKFAAYIHLSERPAVKDQKEFADLSILESEQLSNCYDPVALLIVIVNGHTVVTLQDTYDLKATLLWWVVSKAT